MMIPVICRQCEKVAHLKRLAFAWATFCSYCQFAELKYDCIKLENEEKR